MSRSSSLTAGYLVFVDETKARDYLLVSVALRPAQVDVARRLIRDLTLRGQPRLHMKKESDPRRRTILRGIVDLHPRVTVYRAGSHYPTDLVRRERCIRALVEDSVRQRIAALCLERDATLVSRDRQWLIESIRATCAHDLAYRHEAASAEPALAIPDAIAWAWARGGDWKRRCRDLVVREVEV